MNLPFPSIGRAAIAIVAVLLAAPAVRAGCPADLSGDGNVDGFDLTLMLANWGQPGATDLNNDGTTDGGDLNIVLSSWGCTPLPPIVLLASPDAFVAGTPTIVRFQAQVPTVIIDQLLSIAIVPVDEGGVITGDPIAFPVDNGSLDAGDDIANDGVYSARVTFDPQAPTEFRFATFASIAGSGRFSNAVDLLAVAPISPAQAQAAVDTQESAQDSWEGNLKKLGDTTAAREATVTEILADPDVADAGISSDGVSIWIKYESGIDGGLMLNPEGTRGGPPRRKSRAQPIPAGEESLPARFPIPASPLPLALAGDDETVGNNRVLVWDAYFHEFAPFDEGPFLRDLFQASNCPDFDVTYLQDAACTVASVNSFKNFGTIAMITHGAVGSDGKVVFLTYEVANAASIATNSVDIAAGRVAIWGSYFAIKPDKIASLPGSFERTVVYNGSCQSTANATMSNAFIGGGAGSYLGFSKVVNSDFAQSVAQQFFTEMVTNGDTASEAFATVTPTTDPSAPFAVFQRLGLDELAYGSDFRNGSFEEGLTSWSVAGDGRVIGVLAEYTPTEGSLMGIISTGLGFTTDSGSLSQTFCLAAGAERLEFN
jgi:hypothetical protein